MAIQNQFMYLGRLVRDPVQTETKLGTPRTFYILACNEHYTDKAGQRRQRTDFIPIATYGQQALNDIKYLRSGKEVVVQGRTRQWYNKASGQGGFEFQGDAVRYLSSASGTENVPRSHPANDDLDEADVLEFIAQLDAGSTGAPD
jgi:single-strand DNA-binding protein